MLLDGKKIVSDIAEELKARTLARHSSGLSAGLAIVSVGADEVSARYTRMKRKFGERVGVRVEVREFPGDIPQSELEKEVAALGRDKAIHGIVVQLPLPSDLDTEKVLARIPPEKDVDALTPRSQFLAPVAGVVREMLSRAGVEPRGKRALVIGRGRLVGAPVAQWLTEAGAEVETADIETRNLAELARRAEIIVSGAGAPNLITPEMISDGAILIDAGTSESGGKLAGDIAPECAERASLFTPVPGGVGPVAVAMLFKNLLDTSKKRE